MRFAALVLAISFALAPSALGYEAKRYPKPDPQGSAFERGRIQVHQGNWDRAAGFFEKAVAENPRDFKAYTLLGYSLRHAGRLNKAITAYNRAVEINPGSSCTPVGNRLTAVFTVSPPIPTPTARRRSSRESPIRTPRPSARRSIRSRRKSP